jgi:hypothetical protein
MQRALMQYWLPRNYELVKKALEKTRRFDLIGYGPECLIRPEKGGKAVSHKEAPRKGASHKDSRSSNKTSNKIINKTGNKAGNKRKVRRKVQ